MNKFNVLIDLDCLLDTRVPVAMDLNKDAIAKATGKSLDWWNRDSDLFYRTDHQIHIPGYKEAWEQRTNEILPRSLMTNLVYFLNEYTSDIKSGQFGKGSLEKMDIVNTHIDINIYPYNGLAQEERVAICEAVQKYCVVGTTVSAVYLAPNAITPARLEDCYKSYYVYEFGKWIRNYHRELITTTKPYLVQVFAPAIKYDDVEMPPEDDNDISEYNIDPHTTLKLALSTFIHYEPLPVMLFSMFHRGMVEAFQGQMTDLKQEVDRNRTGQSSSSSSSPSGENSS